MSAELNTTENALDAELQIWLDDADVAFQKREADRRALEKRALKNLGSWEHMKFDLRRHLYKTAIGA